MGAISSPEQSAKTLDSNPEVQTEMNTLSPITPGQFYYIKARHSNKALAVSRVSQANGAKIWQWTKMTDRNNFRFRFEPAGGGYYYIVAKHTGKALAIEGPSTANGAKCVQWDIIRNKPNHMFRLESAGNGGYYIIAKHSGRGLAIEGPSKDNGASCIQWDVIRGKTNHIFSFELAEGQQQSVTLPTVSRFKAATKIRSDVKCSSGSFFDPINGGTCWTCPSGYTRTVHSVTGTKACERAATTVYAKAKSHGKGWGMLGTNCNKGQFWDPNGYCYSCPSGYKRTTSAVSSAKACSKRVGYASSRATKVGNVKCGSGSFYDPIYGGSCWKCPSGYARTVYPVNGQKACELQ